jgi:hypothetical protein
MISRLNIPPQADRGRSHCQLGLQEQETGSRQTFGEDISNPVCCGDKADRNILVKHFLPHKMIVHLNMLRASMEHRIRCQGKVMWSFVYQNISIIKLPLAIVRILIG